MSGQCNDILEELESWYGGDDGRYVLEQTRAALQPHLERAFGYHILQIGPARGLSLSQGSLINHRIYAGERPGEGVDLITRGDELPLECDSVDVVIAHHSLEFVANPHQVLREVQRVLTPQGHLLLVGFNPYSLHGINTRLRGLSGKSLWHAHKPVSENRLRDWLYLLGFELQQSNYLYTVPAAGGTRITRWLRACDQWGARHNVPVGGVYVVHAIKQVAAQNRPRRSLRQHSKRLIGLAVSKPGAAPGVSPTRNPGVAARAGKPSGDSNV